MNTDKPQYMLSYKDDTEYFYSYPTRQQVYDFVSKYFSVEEIALAITNEFCKKGYYEFFEITHGFRFNKEKNK